LILLGGRAHYKEGLMRIGFAFLALLAACLDDPSIESDMGSIIGGTEVDEANDQAVVNIGGCTGTLVAPRVVLTAGHCLYDAVQQGINGGTVRFGSGGAMGYWDSVPVTRLAVHRYYVGFITHDVAMMRLGQDAPASVTPIPFQIEKIPNEELVGEYVRVVGFGMNDGVNQTGYGVKRTVTMEVQAAGNDHIVYGNALTNICQGDSGGPTLRNVFPDGEVVVAVSSFGDAGCLGSSSVARTDAYAEWLVEVFDAWDGPCRNDGNCVTAGCRTPDPDCDVCGYDGVCGSDCPRPDLDCPVAGLIGEDCGDDFDCESRTCVTALDDARIRYCATTCDPAQPAAEACSPPLSVCSDEGTPGTFTCRFAAPTPGAQGSDCTYPEDCRSGVCDPDFHICIEQCGDGLPECTGEFECVDVGGARACTFPREDTCGCRAGQGSPTAALPWLFVGWALMRRRRR
jgi:MYXO-CTERM domain-containing protein